VSCHLTARAGTTAAGFGALLHHLVIPETIAILCTALANLSADAAGPAVEVRAAQHEMGTRLADLGAVHHQPDVIRRGMLTAHLEAMSDGFQANIMAMLTLVDALPHPLTDSHMCISVHILTPYH
jgi:hypothetical protein